MDIDRLLSALHYKVYYYSGREKHWRNHQNFGLKQPWAETKIDNEKVNVSFQSGKPFFIGRYGTIELSAFLKGYRVYQLHDNRNWFKIIRAVILSEPECWKLGSGNVALKTNAGVFPLCEDTLRRFTQIYLDATRELDVLASWQTSEKWLETYGIIQQPDKIDYNILEFAYRLERPWTMALKGKKVLVVSPFSDDIKRHYLSEKRHMLFPDADFLQDFDLQTVMSVNSAGEQCDSVQKLVSSIGLNEATNISNRFRHCTSGLWCLRFPTWGLHQRAGQTSHYCLRSPANIFRCLWKQKRRAA